MPTRNTLRLSLQPLGSVESMEKGLHFAFFLNATESADKPDVVKSSILLHCLGKSARDIYNTFTFDERQEMVYNTIISKFDQYFSPRKNLTFNRFNFLTARQTDDETFDEFYTRLRKLSKDCELGELRNSLIKDIIIIGISDKKLQERLLRGSDIDLEKVLKNGRASEASKQQTKALHNKNSSAASNHANSTTNHVQREQINKCKFCAGSHRRGSCPAYGKQCAKCKKTGHFAKCCLSKPKPPPAPVNSYMLCIL